MSRFNWAPTAYRLLNGVMCIYKPEGLTLKQTMLILKRNLKKDLNALPCYQHEFPLKQVCVEENTEIKDVSLTTEPDGILDWSEHRLVLGDRYQLSDFKVGYVDGLSNRSSGVLVVGIGSFGRESLKMIADSKFLRVYHVKGRFGWATDDFTPQGRILERTTFKHVSRFKLERVCAAAQAAHMKQMYILHGMNPNSQEAYEMAASGLIRPMQRNSEPVLYGVKCIDFQPPDFTLEIHTINETAQYLRCFVHEAGIKLKTTAVCTGIRRLRYGYFDLPRALLRQEWHVDSIVDNIKSNLALLSPERLFVGSVAERTQLLPLNSPLDYLEEEEDMLEEQLRLDEGDADTQDNDTRNNQHLGPKSPNLNNDSVNVTSKIR